MIILHNHSCKYLAHVPHTPVLPEGISGTAQKQNTHTSKHSEAEGSHAHALGWKKYNYPQVW